MAIFVARGVDCSRKPYFPENDLLKKGDPGVLFVN
jgi:hypothetical protein